MIFQHHRFQIWNVSQHPYKHNIAEFSYLNEALPGVTNLESALDYILAVLYPQTKPAVANVAALPSVGNTINDFRVVNDDGDGNAAAYRWEQREGDVAAKWYKIYDMDWGSDSILEQFLTKTQDLYVVRGGYDDLDYTGTAITGTYAGQHIYGGKSASTNLTLSANSGDGTGSNTGYVQFTDNTRPVSNNTIDLGNTSEKWKKIWTYAANIDTLTITTGSITDSTGAISFDNENLSTTGSITGGQVNADNLRLDGNTLSSTDTNGNINLSPNGTGIVDLTASTLTTTGTINAGLLNVDNIRIDANTISSTNTDGDINISPNGAGKAYLGTQVQASSTLFNAHGHLTYFHIDTNLGNLSSANEYTGAVLRTYASPTTGAITGHLDGIMVFGEVDGDKAVSNINGIDARAIYSGTSTATVLYGGYFTTSNTAAGTVTTAASVYAEAPTNTGGGTITNSYALYANGDSAVVGILTVTGEAKVDNLSLNGNTLSSLDTNGNIVIDPNGTGLIEAGAGVYAATDDSFDIGKTGNRFAYAWLSGGVKDGTNTFTVADLMTLRSANYRDAGRTQPAQSGDALFFNGTIWLASAPDTEVDHGSVSGLSDDDHAQYALLAGRAGGQSLTGGTAASESLTLESTSHGTKGYILFSSKAAPTTDASYSGGWQGTDIGGSSNYWRDVYTKGQFYGLRVENVTSLTGASANNAGRLVFHTTYGDLYIDTGGSFARIGVNRFISDTSWNGSDTSKAVTVSSTIEDARNAVWQLCDNTNDYERVYCSIKATSATEVTITVGTPLAAGSYRLIGIE